MAKFLHVNGATSLILRAKILNSTVTTGAGLTGLSSASSGLIISTIADLEATPTAYTVAAATIETITTLGTYAAPTATKCRFKEVDATNHPGVYEFQFADARLAVASAKSLLISVSGATNAAQMDMEIQLATPAVNVTQLGGVVQSLTDLKHFADSGYDPGTTSVERVKLADLLTAYTGNTVQTGDSFARIGATGSGLTSLSILTLAQIRTALGTNASDVIAELSQAAPAASPSLGAALMLLYMALRNAHTSTSAVEKITNDAGTVICKADLTDDATTFTKAEFVTGP